jgi:murein L,D-transpeptidase YcbB/YkuD
MRVIDKSGKTVDSSDFDWKSISAVDFPYRLRAFPGATNALGRLKFEMPNPYFIYLHDTPSRDLFADDLRAFSSGCIRLENPEQLARRLMVREADAAVARLDRALSAERTRHLELGDPIPVVVMYGTVDIDANGELVFARDVYGRDSAVLMAMHSSQPDDRDTIMLAQLSAGTD